MVGLVIVLVAGAALLAAFATGSLLVERAQARQALRRLDGYEIADQRDQEMLEPFGTRVLAPLARDLAEAVRRATPAGYVDGVRRRIVLAGSPPGLETDRILVLKVLGTVSGVVWVPLVYLGLGLGGLFGLAVTGLVWAASFFGPDIVLDRRVEARQHAIRRSLPDVLDLLVISVEAGLGFEQALERTSSAVPGPLSDEFRRMLHETRLGSSRADALRALDERTEVAELRSFILAMLQADTFGVSIAKVLRTQAADMRLRRRQRAQEIAQKAPVKMLFPLVLCVFPAIFVVVLVPALFEVFESL